VDAFVDSFRIEEADALQPAYAAMMLASAGISPHVKSGAEETELTLILRGE
jgi:hypothetical protein